MKTTFFLFQKYFSAHKKRCILALAGTALFIIAMMAVLLYYDCFIATQKWENWKSNGIQTSIVYRADLDVLEQNLDALHGEGSGAVVAVSRVHVADGSRAISCGYIDPQVTKLKYVALREGRLPQAENETAVEASTLAALNLSANVGDTVIIPVEQGGTVAERSLVLVGILENYANRWRDLNGTKILAVDPAPTVLLYPDAQPVLYAHVFLADSALESVITGAELSDNHRQKPDDLPALRMLIAGLFAFFFLIGLFGLYAMTRLTFQERERYLTLLRCVGFDKRKCRRLFGFQAAALWLGACLCSMVVGLLFVGTVWVVQQKGGLVRVAVEPRSVLLPVLASGAVLLWCYLYPVNRLYRKLPLAAQPVQPARGVRRRRSCTDMISIWRRSTHGANRGANAMMTLLAFFCAFLAAFGMGAAVAGAREQNASVVNGTYASYEDYSLYVANGSGEGEHFNITFPRNMGVSAADLQVLYNTKGLAVHFAGIQSMSVHYFLYDPANPDAQPYLRQLKENGRAMDPNETDPRRSLGEKQKQNVCAVIAQMGGSSSAMLVWPSLSGVDYPTIGRYTLTAGSFTQEEFLSGRILVAPDTLASVGDVFRMLTPVIPDENKKEDCRYIITDVTVAATYASGEDRQFFMSAEALRSADPSANYDVLILENTEKQDAAQTQRVEQVLESVTARSDNVVLENRIQERLAYRQTIRNGQLLVGGCVALFLLILLLAAALSTSVKVRSRLHELVLLRAIGAGDRQLRRMIRTDAFIPLFNGYLAGTVLSVLLMGLYLSPLGISRVRMFLY